MYIWQKALLENVCLDEGFCLPSSLSLIVFYFADLVPAFLHFPQQNEEGDNKRVKLNYEGVSLSV